MTLPPERISIKRRRQDEPIETLVLESDLARNNKRRFTDFCFQRLRHTEVAQPASSSTSTNFISASSASTTARNYKDLGIPLVKTSTPGDEVRDFTKYKAAQIEKQEVVINSAIRDAGASISSSAIYPTPHISASKRRFHLMRDLSAILQHSPTANRQRLKSDLRPPLATFMERQGNLAAPLYLNPAVDRILELNHEPDTNQTVSPLSEDSISKRTDVSTFLKSANPSAKRGYSIQDDPTTWDQDSDQLANELAALAFEIDPADATEPPLVISPTKRVAANIEPTQQIRVDPIIIDDDDEFVFETYVRVKQDLNVDLVSKYQNNEVGILVIDDENEDLWEKYVRSDDDDDDWDEEDEDSNAEDNPRNDYPEDEVSSDDEFGRNVYRHRRHASDDEDYDER